MIRKTPLGPVSLLVCLIAIPIACLALRLLAATFDGRWSDAVVHASGITFAVAALIEDPNPSF